MQQFEQKGREFLAVIDRIVNEKHADKTYLFNTLNQIRLRDNCHLALKLPIESGLGDESRFYVYEGNIDPYLDSFEDCDWNEHGSNKIPHIFNDIEVERTPMGAWQAYLLMMSPTIMPVYWHGCYITRTMVFEISDIEKRIACNLPRIYASCLLDVKEDLAPKVTLDDDTAIVSCCYWNNWQGLVRESIEFTYDDNRIIANKFIQRYVLYQYHCGIIC